MDIHNSLKKKALMGPKAMALELVVIAICIFFVLLIADMDKGRHSDAVLLWIPMATMFAGLLGVFFSRRQNPCGALLNLRYVAIYFCTIALMVGVDMLVCLWLGGSLLIVTRNWILLIGSASCVNILSSHIFAKYFHAKTISKVDKVSPFMISAIVLLQIIQMFVSVLGMSWFAALAQIIVRRIVFLPITHIIARLNYGTQARELERSNNTVEYIAAHSVSNQAGEIKEPDLAELTVVGALLLRLPIFGGRLLNWGKKTVVTFVDGCVFLEQILAFSSPTMIVSSPIALLHISYVWKITTAEGNQKKSVLANDRLSCKNLLGLFIQGKQREYTKIILSQDGRDTAKEN